MSGDFWAMFWSFFKGIELMKKNKKTMWDASGVIKHYEKYPETSKWSNKNIPDANHGAGRLAPT